MEKDASLRVNANVRDWFLGRELFSVHSHHRLPHHARPSSVGTCPSYSFKKMEYSSRLSLIVKKGVKSVRKSPCGLLAEGRKYHLPRCKKDIKVGEYGESRRDYRARETKLPAITSPHEFTIRCKNGEVEKHRL